MKPTIELVTYSESSPRIKKVNRDEKIYSIRQSEEMKFFSAMVGATIMSGFIVLYKYVFGRGFDTTAFVFTIVLITGLAIFWTTLRD